MSINSRIKSKFQEYKVEIIVGTAVATAALVYVSTVRVAAREGAEAAARVVKHTAPIQLNPSEVANQILNEMRGAKIMVTEAEGQAMAAEIIKGIKVLRKK